MFSEKRELEESFFRAFSVEQRFEYGSRYDLIMKTYIGGFEKQIYIDKLNDNSIDLLHIDISNNGDILVNMIDIWGGKLSPDGMIAFEGGSIERDNVEWMKKYNFKSIGETLMNNPMIKMEWCFQVLEPFPSLTLLWKK